MRPEIKEALAHLVGHSKRRFFGFEPNALDVILKVTNKYPDFLQQWAHDAWNIADNSPITDSDRRLGTAAFPLRSQPVDATHGRPSIIQN